MASVGLKAFSVVTLLVVLFAIVYKKNTDDELKDRLQVVLDGLLRAERKVPYKPDNPKKIAVGLGACLDGFASAIDVLNIIDAHPPEIPEHFGHIETLQQLEKVFTYFFMHGAAGERFVKNETLFTGLVAAVKSLQATRYAVGGNAPVMAARFAAEGCKVLLGAKMTASLQKEIHHNIKLAGGQMIEDDMHLLLEYAKGEDWGKYQSPRANRFIVHSDTDNPKLGSVEAFAAEMQTFHPHLLVIGGLQMMDNFPFEKGERLERLAKLRDVMASVTMDTRIHFEMASFAEEDCLQDVIENVAKYSDSLGMNEQELPNIHSLLTNGTVTLISDPYPRIATTLDQMRAVYKILRDTSETGGRRKLTRLHVHTLAYQAILTTKGSAWKNTMSAAAHASLTANRHVCGSKYIHTEKARILMDDSFSTSREQGSQRIPFKTERPVSCWEEEDYQICIAPVLVCTDVVQTGGGGDNISSAGLVLQI